MICKVFKHNPGSGCSNCEFELVDYRFIVSHYLENLLQKEEDAKLKIAASELLSLLKHRLTSGQVPAQDSGI